MRVIVFFIPIITSVLTKGSFGVVVLCQVFFLGMSEESVTEVTRELSSLGFIVWDTCLGDHGVTLAFT